MQFHFQTHILFPYLWQGKECSKADAMHLGLGAYTYNHCYASAAVDFYRCYCELGIEAFLVM
jgi:hypothetical protein